MGRVDVGAALKPAWEHMVRVLFGPFALKKWLALGFVSMFAAYGQGGSVNFRTPGPSGPQGPGPSGDFERVAEQAVYWITHHVGLLVLLGVALILTGFVFAWLGSVLKFVYLNQITSDPRAIREPFARFTHLGTSFFLWQLALGAAVMAALGILVALPVLGAFVWGSAGWGVKGLVIVWAIAVGLAILISSSVAGVFAQDFAAPVMFLRNLRVMEAWEVVLPIVRSNGGPMVVYVLMLIGISIGATIYSIFAALAVMIAFLLPGGILAAGGYGIWVQTGRDWSPALLVYAGVMGSALMLAICYALSCAMQPAVVFRRAYSLVILGQADHTLATIPWARQQPPPPPPYWQPPDTGDRRR